MSPNQPQRYTISQALQRLRAEFPDLTPSSLRFLERQGLLQPQRSPGGHRLYSEADLARLRVIKRLQSRRYYPLDVIRHLLGKLERAEDLETEFAFLESLYGPIAYDPNFVPLSQGQLAKLVGLASTAITRLEEIGLLFPHANGNGRRSYDEDDLRVAEVVAREVGLGAEIEEFQGYAAAMQVAAQQEFSLFYKLAGGQEGDQERMQQLKEGADLVHAILRAKLTRQLLAQARKDR